MYILLVCRLSSYCSPMKILNSVRDIFNRTWQFIDLGDFRWIECGDSNHLSLKNRIHSNFKLNFRHSATKKLISTEKSFNRFHTSARPLWTRNIYQSSRKKKKKSFILICVICWFWMDWKISLTFRNGESRLIISIRNSFSSC